MRDSLSIPTIDDVLSSPVTRTALKKAIAAFFEMDPVDAAKDAEFLADLMRERCQKAFEEMRRSL